MHRERNAVALETARIANFSPEQLRKLARKVSSNGPNASTIPRVAERRDLFPLSFGQERLWFLDQLNPGDPVYNLPLSFRFRMPSHTQGNGSRPNAAPGMGALNELHRRMINQLVRRHDILRTRFPMVDGSPMQVVDPVGEVPVHFLHLPGLSEQQREATARRIVREETAVPFDLARGPLCRFGLIQFAPDDFLGFATCHHILVDGWSLKVLIEEFQAMLFSALTSLPSELPELPIQYGDYAVWQRQWLRGEVWERLRSYWIPRLEGVTDLQLPTDRPRPALQTSAGGAVELFLPQSICNSLRQLGQRHGVTLSMTMLAAWLTLLMRYTGEQDVAVCTPVANRSHVETERLIGFFVNTLVVRVDLSGDPTFSELLKRVWQVCTSAYAHQEMPFEKLVQELRVERDLGRNPLSRVAFQLVDIPSTSNAPSRGSTNGLLLALFEIPGETSIFDVNCDLWHKPDGIHGTFTYSTDLFDASTIERMTGHYQNLLRAALTDPEQRLSELEMLGHREREQMLVTWNATARDFDPSVCLHHLFEAQVKRTPNATAVQCGSRQWSYAELNASANRVAHRLSRLGAGSEVRVGLCMERRPEMLAAMLGIMKAGATYVPLDPNYPLDRLRFMLADSQAAVLITQNSVRNRIEEFDGHVILLNDESLLDIGSPENLYAPVEPDHLAYLIYTSGSTGRPKGVAIKHHSATTMVRWAGETFSAAQLECMLASTSICFDLSVFELFVPLAFGHRVHLVHDVLALTSIPAGAGVTFVNTVPSAMTELLRLGQLPASVTTVGLAGEPLSNSLVQQLYREPNVTAVLNLYGPSEDTTYSTWILLDKDAAGITPIGRPIANTQVYLLDPHLQPVPIGVSGELYLGGAGLARCYLNRPELTAQSFIPDLFSGQPGARLYRTGDLARYRPNGVIEYQGRRDSQIKIRGFRIELGEIETTLSDHPEVHEAAVLVHRSDGDTRLIAYAVCSPSYPATNQEIRAFLRGRLPEHMVPSAIIFLDRMPLNANGKLDRKALPAAHKTLDSLCSNQSEAVAPRSSIEKRLLEIFGEVLGSAAISVHDNFFVLGGHSLLATRVIHRIRHAFGIDLPLRSIFDTPTVAGLAAKLALSAGPYQQQTATEVIVPISRGTPLPLSFAQQRLWFLDKLQPGSDLYSFPAAASIYGPLDIASLEWAIEEIVRRHEVLRTCFIEHGGEPLQKVMPTSPCPVTFIDFTSLPFARRKAHLDLYLEDESRSPFDLAAGPVLRVHLFRLDEEEHVLLLHMHHIVSDAWSVGVLIEELGALYQARLAHAPSPLPDLPIQYADFAAWQRRWLQGDVLEQKLAYWKTQLHGLPAVLPLRLDRPRPAVQRSHGNTLRLQLPSELGEHLRQVADLGDATLFMVLLAVFQVLLLRRSGATDFAIGTPVANRSSLDTGRLLGFFVNTLVLRTDASGDPTFTQLLARVRKTALDAFEHQDLPFEKLVEELRPQRQLGVSPLFQVLFAVNRPLPAVAAGSLRIAPVEIASTTAKFDLTMTVDEVADRSLSVRMEYSTNLFEEATVRGLLDEYRDLLQSIVTHPGRRISELEVSGSVKDAEWTRGPKPAATAAAPPSDQQPSPKSLSATNTPFRSQTPRNASESKLVHIWEDLLQVRPIGVFDSFFDLGGHSLLAVRMAARIRAAFHREIPLMTLFEAPDIERLARLLDRTASDGPGTPLVPIQPGGSRRPLFMVHPVGGQVLCFQELARHLGTDQPVYGLEASSAPNRSEGTTSIEQMADSYIAAIRTVSPSGPYSLGGWSMGGIVAFEMARRLRAAGEEVRLLAIIDSPAPGNLLPTDSSSQESHDFSDLTQDLGLIDTLIRVTTGESLDLRAEDLDGLGHEERMQRIFVAVRARGIAPDDVDSSFLKQFLETAQRNFQAERSFHPGVYAGRIDLFRAQDALRGFEAGWNSNLYRDPQFGWQQLSSEPVAVHSIPGDHVSILRPPHIATLAATMRQHLEGGQHG